MININVSPAEVYDGIANGAETMKRSIPHLIGWRNRWKARRELAELRRDPCVVKRSVGYEGSVASYAGDKLETVAGESVVVRDDGLNEELMAEMGREKMGHVNYDVATKMEQAFDNSKRRNTPFLVVEVGQRLYKVLFAVDKFLSRKSVEYWDAGQMRDFYRVSNEQREIREEMMPELIVDCQDAVDVLAKMRNGFDVNDDEDWERFR